MKFTLKNIAKIIAVFLLIYAPAAFVVIFTDFEDKNLIVIPFLTATTGSILIGLVRYYYKNKTSKSNI